MDLIPDDNYPHPSYKCSWIGLVDTCEKKEILNNIQLIMSGSQGSFSPSGGNDTVLMALFDTLGDFDS